MSSPDSRISFPCSGAPAHRRLEGETPSSRAPREPGLLEGETPSSRAPREPLWRWAAVLLLLCFTGCIHLEQTLLLNGDGSLVVTYHYSIAEGSADTVATGQQVIEQWQGNTPTGAPHWLASREAVQQHFSGAGIRVQDFSTAVKGGRRHVDITVFAADGPAAINRGLFGALTCERTADGRVRVSADIPRIPVVEDPEKRRAISALLDDLYLKLEFRVPAEIVETSADTRRRRSAIWEFAPSKGEEAFTDPPAIACEFDASRMEWAQALPLAD